MLRSWIFAVLITFVISLSAYASDLNERLLDAAGNGQTSEVLTLLNAGADVNAKDALQRTALLLTIAGGHVDTVQALLDAGADVDVKSWDGATALMQASYGEHSKIVQVLVEAGADVNIRSPHGSTALIYAARKGRTENVQILLDAGADVEATCDGGSTALLEAASLGHTGTAQVLLEARANVNRRDERGSTALMRAAEIGITELVQVLLNAGADVNVKDFEGRTALMRGRLFPEIVDLLKGAERMEAEWFQTGNTLPITQLETEQSEDLEDNRIGGMWVADIYTRDHLNWFVNNINRLGLKWVRLSIDWFDWEEIEEKEAYSKYYIYPTQDEAMEGLINKDIKVLYTLLYWNETIKEKIEEHEERGEEFLRFKTEEEIQNYLNYVQFIVHHFKDKIEYYEILNEPDGDIGQHVEVNDYINLVKRVIPVIREEDPKAKIVVGGPGYLAEFCHYEYLFAILRSDIMPLVDAVSWHPMYGTSPEYDEEYYYNYSFIVQEIKDVASSHGFKGEYIAEEMCWRTPRNPNPYEPATYSETVAAKYYARGMVIHLGMNILTGIAGEDFDVIQPIVAVVQNLCTVMAGAKTVELPTEIESEATNIRSYSFSLNDDTLITLWTDGVAIDEDPGVEASLTLDGFAAQEALGIDVLEGHQQPIITSTKNGNLTIENLIIRDYPLILHITKSSTH